MPIKLRIPKDGESYRPGVVLDSPRYHPPDKCPAGWSNCGGRHIIVMFPHPIPSRPDHGVFFDITSRASNCTKKDDTEHRCWVVHGEPPDLHVDKAGLTCNAGAGSFQIGNWHGYIRKGHIEQ